MSTDTLTRPTPASAEKADLLAVIHELGPHFADRTAAHDAGDTFVAENFAELKARGVFAAAVPAELGGGGQSHAAICEALRALGSYCGSTSLAPAMHSHQVTAAARRRRHQNAPTDGLLKRIATEHLALLTSGANDWLQGSGAAERVEGGYRINARKAFASGAPTADLYSTMAVFEDPEAGPTVLHFAVPMTSEGIEILPTWQTLGMRATGSHDIRLTDVFVPDKAITVRRPQGVWHPMFDIILMHAMPVICAVYVGIVDSAVVLVRKLAARRKDATMAAYLVGGVENEAAAMELALREMIAVAGSCPPGQDTTNRILICRTLVAQSAFRAANLALDAAGGAGFYRAAGLERLFRDVQALRYHPLPEAAQRELTGRLALGLPA